MLKPFILALLLLYSFSSPAQYQYTPFPLDSALWTYTTNAEPAPNKFKSIHHFLFKGKDTTINGNKYALMYKRSSSIWCYGSAPCNNFTYNDIPRVAGTQDQLVAAIREKGKKVYIKWFDIFSYYGRDSAEKVLYDFNLTVGDTGLLNFRYSLHGINSNGRNEHTHYIVQKVDTQFIGNRDRKIYTVNGIDSMGKSLAPDPYIIIEGIGTTQGIFTYGDMMRGGTGFNCHIAPNIQYMSPFHTSPICFYIHEYGTPTSIEQTASNNTISIYPNPAHEVVNITAPTGTNISLTNITGKQVYHTTTVKKKEIIQLAHMPSGLYIISLFNKEKHISEQRKLMKL